MIEEEYEGYTIVLTAEEEDAHPLDLLDFPDKEAEEAFMTDFHRGQMMWFCARVSARKFEVELADTYLGGCFYKSLESFKDTSDYYEDMREEVVASASRFIENIMKAQGTL